MRLFIWQGEGVSCSYHDDGTLVLLAETEEAARSAFDAQVERLRHRSDALDERARRAYWRWEKAYRASVPEGMLREFDRREAWMTEERWEKEQEKVPQPSWYIWRAESARGRRYWELGRQVVQVPDAPIPERPADIVLDLDQPCIVAFNGGGYD